MGELSQIFRSSQQDSPDTGVVPMLNTMHRSFSGFLSQSGQLSKKKKLFQIYKNTPELVGLVLKVARDIVGDYHFEPVKPEDSNRNRLMRANRFEAETMLYDIMLSQAIDILVTGEAFGWIGRIDKKEAKEIMKKVAKKNVKHRPHLSVKEKKDLYEKFTSMNLGDTDFIDEELKRPRKYRHVASTTMEVQHDEHDIKRYVQKVNHTNPRAFSTDEIIHFKPIPQNGRVNGFTPLESVVTQVELLRMMWQNQMSLHKNGGVPDHVFMFKDMHPNDPGYEKLKQQIKKYKLAENKHGNLTFTGDVDIETLERLDGMQFMDQGLYITGLLALQWQIPRSSIPFILKDTNTKDDTGGNSERGYWETIEAHQKSFDAKMNTQLFIPHFGVKLVHDNKFIQKDVQKQTKEQLKLNNIKSMNEILSQNGKKLSESKVYSMLGITKQDTQDAEREINPSYTNNQQLPSDEVNNSDSEQNVSDRKKDEQDSVNESRGMKPTGTGPN